MATKELHMRIGQNLGDILLDIAQNRILEGNTEGAFNTYTSSLHGFTRNHALMVLKNQAVLTVDEENQVMNLQDDPKLIEENAHNIYDWESIVKDKINSLDNIRNSRLDVLDKFNHLYKGDIENYNIIEMMLRYYTDEALHQVGIHNIAAGIIGSKDGRLHNNQYDNPQSRWDKFCDQMEYEDNPDVPNCKKTLYWTVEYVKLIKMLHKEYMKFEPMYNFLVKYEFIKRIPFIEQKIENILYILKKFSDTGTGYYHPMCNTGLYEYKETLFDDLLKTKYGKEYCQNGILLKNIMDGYDAGWLSPDGEFYGEIGETSNFMHMSIAEDIFHGNSVYASRMLKDGISEFGGVDSPDYWLEKHGWIKIHHDEIYGSFIGQRDEEPTKDFPYAYNPTDIQIKMVCDYADKFYGGKFLTEARVIGLKEKAEVSTYKVRQMDEFKLHETFGR